MRTLYLHIGHGKTGSSWLQSCFTLSRDRLEASGIQYPPGKFDNQAADGKVTPGNGQVLIDALDNRRAARRLAGTLTAGNALFSSELLANQIAERLESGALKALMDRLGFEALSVLLFIRDPLEHLASHYQQVVKRAGETKSLIDWAKRYDTPERCAAALKAITAAPFASATVWNYSRERAMIGGRTADWLGVGRDFLVQPERPVVNRSLTADELALQLVFNRHLGRCGPLISDPLGELLPGIEAELEMPPYRAAKGLIDRLRPALETVNAMVPASQAYTAKPPNRWTQKSPNKNTITLSVEQLDVVAARLAQELQKAKS